MHQLAWRIASRCTCISNRDTALFDPQDANPDCPHYQHCAHHGQLSAHDHFLEFFEAAVVVSIIWNLTTCLQARQPCQLIKAHAHDAAAKASAAAARICKQRGSAELRFHRHVSRMNGNSSAAGHLLQAPAASQCANGKPAKFSDCRRAAFICPIYTCLSRRFIP